jgi:hypothetical protein
VTKTEKFHAGDMIVIAVMALLLAAVVAILTAVSLPV